MLSVFCGEGFVLLHYAGCAVAAVTVVLSLITLSRHGNIFSSILKRISKK